MVHSNVPIFASVAIALSMILASTTATPDITAPNGADLFLLVALPTSLAKPLMG